MLEKCGLKCIKEILYGVSGKVAEMIYLLYYSLCKIRDARWKAESQNWPRNSVCKLHDRNSWIAASLRKSYYRATANLMKNVIKDKKTGPKDV